MNLFESDPDFEILINNVPLTHFCGLSRNQVHYLIYYPFSPNSSLQLLKNIDSALLDKVPFFRLAEALQHIILQEKELKLTATGALPVKIVKDLYALKYFPDDMIESGINKLYKETDWLALECAHVVAVHSKLVKKSKGKLSLPKSTFNLIETSNRVEIFKRLLQSFTQSINWGAPDGYPDYPVAQLGWAFSVFLLLSYGVMEHSSDFYSDKYLTAFPILLEEFSGTKYTNPIKSFKNCYRLRNVERFWEWWGFITYIDKTDWLSDIRSTFVKSEVLEKVFVFD